MERKIIKSNITANQLDQAQGFPNIDWSYDYYLYLECPINYDVNLITPEDIIHDNQITIHDVEEILS